MVLRDVRRLFLNIRHEQYSRFIFQVVYAIDVRKRFFGVFYFGQVFTFLTFFSFSKRFIFKKTLAKFIAASRLTRSTFKITATK